MKSGLLYGLFFIIILLAASSGHSETQQESCRIQTCQQIVNHDSIIPTASIAPEELLPSSLFFRVTVSETAHTHFSTAQLRANLVQRSPQRQTPQAIVQFYTSETDDSHHLI